MNKYFEFLPASVFKGYGNQRKYAAVTLTATSKLKRTEPFNVFKKVHCLKR